MARLISTISIIVILAGCQSHPPTIQTGIARIVVATYHWVGTNLVEPQSMVSYYHHTRANAELGFIRFTTIDSNGIGLTTDFSRNSDSHTSMRFKLAEPTDTMLQRLGSYIPDTLYFERNSWSDAFPRCMLLQRKNGSFTLISYNDSKVLPPLLLSLHELVASIRGDSVQEDIPLEQVRHLVTLIVARDDSRLLTWAAGIPTPVPDADTMIKED